MKRLLGGLRKYFRSDIYYRLLPYLWPYKGSMALVVLILLSQVGLGLLEPWSLKILIDNGLLNKPLPLRLEQVLPSSVPGNGRAIVVFAVMAGILLHLINKVLDILGDYLKSCINAGVNLTFQADLFNHLQRLSFSYHDQTTVGDSMYRLNSDTGFLSTLLWGNFRHLLKSVITLAGILWIMILLDWQIALLALSVAPFLYGAIGFYGRHFKAKSKRVKGLESQAQTVVQEVFYSLHGRVTRPSEPSRSAPWINTPAK